MYKKLVGEYIDLTGAMLSALKVRNLDIFENLIKTRKILLNKLSELDDKYIIEEEKVIIRKKILELELKINIEMDLIKHELGNEQKLNKLKMNDIKKKRDVHSKYRNSNDNSGLIFDKKK